MTPFAQHIQSILPVAEERIALIENRLIEKQCARKEHFLRAGELAKSVYFITSGCVRTYIYDLNGAEHNITFSMENWWFGDLQSFIKQPPASFYIQALEPTSVLSIHKKSWDYLMLEVPEFSDYTRALFRNTMFAHENRIVQNLSFTAEERYQFFLAHYPNLSQRISQKHIASYIGITPEFLSMLRSRRTE
ncbi:MAG: Crp/Fnr family transcriptional regulator [Salibacteraceae bacterium]